MENLNPAIDGDFELSQIGLYGLAVMGQNLAMNIASAGFSISVSNRSNSKVDACVERSNAENGVEQLRERGPYNKANLRGFHEMGDFIKSIKKPRSVILLVKAGAPVEASIAGLMEFLEEGDRIIDGGNEWYANTERRAAAVGERGVLYMGMGVSGGEKGARWGPSLMPGGDRDVYFGDDARIEKILLKVAALPNPNDFAEDAQDLDQPCVMYLGPGGFGNYVKMVHNGIEYGDMQLIAEAYDLLKLVCGLGNDQIADIFTEWNQNPDLKSFLVEITADIFRKKDDLPADESKGGDLVDYVVDSTGSKGTGMWTVQELATQGISGPTISAALNMRYMSSVIEERAAASERYAECATVTALDNDEARQGFIKEICDAMYASKICSYAQGMNLIKAYRDALLEQSPDAQFAKLGDIAKIWRAGCIIRANFLNDITAAYNASDEQKDGELASLLMDEKFSNDLKRCEAGWRSVVQVAVANGVPVPAISGSLAYFDAYRRARLPANLTQAQRDYFGAHTYLRTDGHDGNNKVHSEWVEPTRVRDDLAS